MVEQVCFGLCSLCYWHVQFLCLRKHSFSYRIYFSCLFVSWLTNAPKYCWTRLYLHSRSCHVNKQGLIFDWLPFSINWVSFVWRVDPHHVGPPAPDPLTHMIKGKGLPPSICSYKGEVHISISIIYLTWSSLRPLTFYRTVSSSIGVFLKDLYFFLLHLRDVMSDQIHLLYPAQGQMFIHLCGVNMPKQPWSVGSFQHPHPQNVHAQSHYLFP